MKKKLTFKPILFLLILNIFTYAQEVNSYVSSYTSINEKDCIKLDSDDIGSIEECEPFGNIVVRVVEGDIRQTLTLTRNRHEYILDFQLNSVATFSLLGEKIEWLHEKNEPTHLKGMIVKLDVNREDGDFDHLISLLVVSKITREEICVIGKVLPQENQRAVAIEMLNRKNELPCLKDRLKK